MIGLDTNVLVRYLAQDDARQSAQATRLIEERTEADPAFVSIVTVIETVWVLTHIYAMDRQQIGSMLAQLLRVGPLTIQMHDVVATAARDFAVSSADFADHLIECLCAAAGCDDTLTFDKTAARDAGMRLMATRLA